MNICLKAQHTQQINKLIILITRFMNVEKREDCSSLGCAHFEILLPLLACVSLSGSNFAVVLKTGVENILLG